jgi:hypothetical protein
MMSREEWPLPTALPLAQCLRSLTDNAGFSIDEDNFDNVLADRPDAVVAWVAAAGRYVAADYALHLLQRPVAWMRDELAPHADVDTDDIVFWAGRLYRCVTAHQALLRSRENAHTEFDRACDVLTTEGLLDRDSLQWHITELIPDGLTAACQVKVPADTGGPWPLVKVYQSLLEELATADLTPAPSRPVVRRTLYGFTRVDHQQAVQRLLPDRDGLFRLRGFGWHTAPSTEDRSGEVPAAPQSPSAPSSPAL